MGLLDDRATMGLLHRAHDGDGEAWGTLVLHHGARLRRLARLKLDPRLAGRLDPDDVVQEALADAARSLAAFFGAQDLVSFSAWLRQRLLERVHRLHRAHLGTRARSVLRESGALPRGDIGARSGWLGRLADPGTTPSRHATRAEAGRLVREALAALREVDREVLVLFFFEGYSHGEIGLILDLAPDAVKARQHRASCRLAAQLRRAHPEWCHASYPRARRRA